MNTDFPQVTNYLSYRKYLRDFYQAKKSLRPEYSHRVFMGKAGLSSPSHLKMVIDGKRNLTHKTIPKYLKALGFKLKRENQFFELLVRYEQEKDHGEKVSLFKKIMDEKSKTGLTPLEKHHFDFLSRWHYVAIYVLVGMDGFKEDLDWISEKMVKKVSSKNIQNAFVDLEKMGLIERGPGGLYRQSNGALSTPDQVQSLAIKEYHHNMLDLASHALIEVDPELREFNGATIPININNLAQLKEKIRAFRKELNELASNTENTDHVYQLNMQLFPLTEEIK